MVSCGWRSVGYMVVVSSFKTAFVFLLPTTTTGFLSSISAYPVMKLNAKQFVH